MTSLGKLTVELEAETKDLQQQFGKAAKALKDFEAAARDAEKVQKHLAKGILDTEVSVGKFAVGLGLAAVAMKKAFGLAEDAARTNAARTFFEQSGKSVEEFRQATKGLVSDADLIKKSNLADTMGITGEHFKTLATIAQASAAKTGQSYSHMLDSIIIGTARESRLLLDNLGIIVDVTKAREAYVQKLRDEKKLGDLASQTNKVLAERLTDTAEKMAFLTSVQTAGSPVLDQYAKAGESSAEKFDKFGAAIENLREALGNALVNNGLLDALNSILATMVDIVAEGQSLEGLLTLGRGYGGNGMAAVGADKRAGELQKQQAKDRQIEIQRALGARGMTPYEITGFRPNDGPDMHPDAKRFREAHAMGLDKILPTDELERLEFSAVQAAQSLQLLVAEHNKLNKETGLVPAPGMEKSKEPSPFKPDEGKTGKPGKSEWGAVDPSFMGIGGWTGGWFEDALKQGAKWAEDENKKYWADRLVQLEVRQAKEKALADAEDAVRREAFENLEKERAWREKEAAKLDSNIAFGVNLGGAAAQGDSSGFISMLSSAIGAAFGAPQAGAAIGSVLGPLLSELEVVGELFRHIASGATLLIQHAFGPLLETLRPLGPALEFLLASVGHLVGSLLAPLLPIVELVVVGLTWLVDIIALAVVAISPFAEALLTVGKVVWEIAFAFLQVLAPGSGLINFSDWVNNAAVNAMGFSNMMVDAALFVNNGMVKFVQGIGEWSEATFGTDFGLSDFGEILSREDFQKNIDATEDNTTKTEENTKAVRDLSRELRNMPQGYKINRAVYRTVDPAKNYVQPGQYNFTQGIHDAFWSRL